MKTLLSWNVNGIRAAEGKGLTKWLSSTQADLLCIQETKAQIEQLDQELIKPEGYNSFFESADKKGYSGTAVYYKEEPLDYSNLGIKEFDSEGRGQIIKYPDFTLINCYFPNSQSEGKRLDYKLDFCNAILEIAKKRIEKKENIIICGDYNIAHKPIDLANPKRNEKNPGYLAEEREWMENFLADGFTDSFRLFNQNPAQYTWWSYRTKARDKNIGWRLDYFCTNDAFASKIEKAEILSDVMGSDHCPVSLTIK